MIDLDAYFARIGYRGPAAPSLDVLNGIVHAHISTIPFENLDVLLGRGIGLEPEALQKKLVADRRGGYCFEHNGLLLLVLHAIGFDAVPLSARVRYQRPRDYTPARTHLFLRVTIDGLPWLADVGFGALSPTAAIRLDVVGEQQTPHEPRRIVREKTAGSFTKFGLATSGTTPWSSRARTCLLSIASSPTGSPARTRSHSSATG